jgi:hypothetical protein
VNGAGTRGGPGPECFDMIIKGFPRFEMSKGNKEKVVAVWRKKNIKSRIGM